MSAKPRVRRQSKETKSQILGGIGGEDYPKKGDVIPPYVRKRANLAILVLVVLIFVSAAINSSYFRSFLAAGENKLQKRTQASNTSAAGATRKTQTNKGRRTPGYSFDSEQQSLLQTSARLKSDMLRPAKGLKTPYPIFLASFSKSGTTSTYSAFACYLGHQYVAHRWTTSSLQGGRPEFIGACMQHNIERNKPPFEGCGTNQYNQTQTVVWTDTAYSGSNSGCYHPNIQALDAIWDAYPYATLLLVKRNATAWFNSANSRRAGFIHLWATACGIMPNTTEEAEWVDFYNAHVKKVRAFAASRQPRLTYVELELESPDTGRLLEESIGLPRTCWKHCPSSFTQQECKDLQKKRNRHRF